MKLKGIIFDVDGTIADTEEIHRQAFNQTFIEFNIDWHWSVDDYHKLLSISGGKERFKKCLDEDKTLRNKLDNPDEFIKELHNRKSENYRALLASDGIQLRPGIARLIKEARDSGLKLGVATSSSTANLRILINKTLNVEPEELFDAIVSNDIVSDQKPLPALYIRVLNDLGLSADSCIAIEDTRNGNLSALNAGLHTIITTHTYTIDNDFSGASLVVNHLGDPDNAYIQAQGADYANTFVDVALLNQIISFDNNEQSNIDIADAALNLN
jgi:HAD superfamily hydrolase (TIGR01509 family)